MKNRLTYSLLSSILFTTSIAANAEPINQTTFDSIVKLANRIKTHATPIEVVDITNVTMENVNFTINEASKRLLPPEVQKQTINALNCSDEERSWDEQTVYFEEYSVDIGYSHKITTENSVKVGANLNFGQSLAEGVAGTTFSGGVSTALEKKETIDITNTESQFAKHTVEKTKTETIKIPARTILIYDISVTNRKLLYKAEITGTINALLYYHVLTPTQINSFFHQKTATGKSAYLFTRQWLKSVFFKLQPGPRTITVPAEIAVAGFTEVNAAQRFIEVEKFPDACNVDKFPEGLKALINDEDGLIVTRQHLRTPPTRRDN